MFCTRFLVPALLLGLAAFGQEHFTGYLQPSAAINYKLSPRFSQNAALNQRTFFYRDSQQELRARQLDAVLFTQYRVSANASASFGIQYRFRQVFEPDSGDEIRLTQQYNIALKPAVVRFGPDPMRSPARRCWPPHWAGSSLATSDYPRSFATPPAPTRERCACWR